MAQCCRTDCQHGTFTVRAGGDDTLLVGLGVLGDFYWRIPSYHSLSHEERSCPSQTSYDQWTDCKKGARPKGHHALCLQRIHRLACGASGRPPFSPMTSRAASGFQNGGLWVVDAATLRGNSQDALVAIGFYFIFLVYRRTHSLRRPSKSQKIRKSSLPDHTRWCDTQCMQAHSSISLARRLPSARTGLFALVFMTSFLIWRLLDEERFLAKNLPGYTEYQKQVQYRLVPYVW
jgi:hypothetical protein